MATDHQGIARAEQDERIAVKELVKLLEKRGLTVHKCITTKAGSFESYDGQMLTTNSKGQFRQYVFEIKVRGKRPTAKETMAYRYDPWTGIQMGFRYDSTLFTKTKMWRLPQTLLAQREKHPDREVRAIHIEFWKDAVIITDITEHLLDNDQFDTAVVNVKKTEYSDGEARPETKFTIARDRSKVILLPAESRGAIYGN